jgi:hypothetical protein
MERQRERQVTFRRRGTGRIVLIRNGEAVPRPASGTTTKPRRQAVRLGRE